MKLIFIFSHVDLFLFYFSIDTNSEADYLHKAATEIRKFLFVTN